MSFRPSETSVRELALRSHAGIRLTLELVLKSKCRLLLFESVAKKIAKFPGLEIEKTWVRICPSEIQKILRQNEAPREFPLDFEYYFIKADKTRVGRFLKSRYKWEQIFIDERDLSRLQTEIKISKQLGSNRRLTQSQLRGGLDSKKIETYKKALIDLWPDLSHKEKAVCIRNSKLSFSGLAKLVTGKREKEFKELVGTSELAPLDTVRKYFSASSAELNERLVRMHLKTGNSGKS